MYFHRTRLGKLLNNNIIDKIICMFLHFVPSQMKKLWFVIGYLIQTAQHLAHNIRIRWGFFLARWKISNTIDIFLKASRGQILTKTIRTREQLAELTASRGGVS
jgi:hypothetical protein